MANLYTLREPVKISAENEHYLSLEIAGGFMDFPHSRFVRHFVPLDVEAVREEVADILLDVSDGQAGYEWILEHADKILSVCGFVVSTVNKEENE